LFFVLAIKMCRVDGLDRRDVATVRWMCEWCEFVHLHLCMSFQHRHRKLSEVLNALVDCHCHNNECRIKIEKTDRDRDIRLMRFT